MRLSLRTLSATAGLVLGCVAIGCAGRGAFDDGGTIPWRPPEVVEAVCRDGEVWSHRGPLPEKRYRLAVVVDVDRRGRVRSADVVDRWPLPGSCNDVAPWERPLLDAFRKDYEFRPALRNGRPVDASVIHVLGSGASPEMAQDQRVVSVSCTATAPLLVDASLQNVGRHLGDPTVWDGYHVTALVEVDAEGAVSDARIVTRTPRTADPFAEPWMTIVTDWIREDWRFVPATRDGVPIATSTLRHVRLLDEVGGPRAEVFTVEEAFRRNPPAPPRPRAPGLEATAPAAARPATPSGLGTGPAPPGSGERDG